ncbi:MAG: hypothetical protein IKC35_01760 [Clostridia bacterium]|nr:hypothetical protein [Clostridia bacterium]
MREIASRLKQTVLCDGGGAEKAFKQVLKGELFVMLKQYMQVNDIEIEIVNEGLEIKIYGANIKKIGYYTE